MSSKSRRHKGRHKPHQQQFTRPQPGKPGSRPKRGTKTRLIVASAIIVLAVAVYAFTNSKNNSATAPTPNTSAQSPAPSSPAPTTVFTASTRAGDEPRLDPAPAPVPVPATPIAGARIQFASPVYDFGKVRGDEIVHCVFTFTNTGTADLELPEVTPACGCMKMGEWTHKVPPGQTGTIAVNYDSHHYTGGFAKSVFVTCNDSNQPKPMLEIRGNVWRPVQLSPSEYAIMELTEETPSNAASVKIISHMDQPLVITNLINQNKAFAVELKTNQPGQEYELVVSTQAPFPTSSQAGNVILKTANAESPEIQVSTRANVTPLVMAIPYFIRVPAPPLTTSVPSTVWIRNHSTNFITISEPTVNAKGVDVQIKEDQPGKQFSVTVNFPPGFEATPQTELSLKTSHPKFPVLKVPVQQVVALPK